MSPSMADINTRVLVSAGVIVGGTALAVASGGVAAVTAGALAGIFGNIFAEDLAVVWRKRKDDPRYKHPDEDLNRLVGDAIARVLYNCAEDIRLTDPAARKWCETLAKKANVLWNNVAPAPGLAAFDEAHLPNIFAAAGEDQDLPLLDPHTWGLVLDNLRDAANLISDKEAQTFAAQRLHEDLFHAIRERFEIDFSGDGRAYAALNIDMSARILASVEKLLDDKASVLGVAPEITELLQKIQNTLTDIVPAQRKYLTAVQAAAMKPVLQQIGCVQDRLAQIGEQIEDHERREEERHQDASAQSAAMQAQLDRVEKQLSAALANKPAGQDASMEVSPELREAAAELLERGNKKQQALAAVALKQFEKADELIAELEVQPLREAFEILTLKGDRWYQAGEFDKAIGPYEQALALHPNRFSAINNLAAALNQARLGDISSKVNRAITLYRVNLAAVQDGSIDWAMTQANIGVAWSTLPTGVRTENLQQAIQCLQAALTVYSRAGHPAEWAVTQNNLGTAWAMLPTGNLTENLQKAIACYEASLEVFTCDAHPVEWAKSRNNLGNAWTDLSTADHAENIKTAVAHYEAALKIYTREAHPVEWARTQNNLGIAWTAVPASERTEKMEKAIICFEAALEVFTPDAQPVEWAEIQNNLAAAWSNRRTGDRAENLRASITCHKAALKVRTREAHPVDWATSQYNLGTAWGDLHTGDRAENLQLAAACYKSALEVYTRNDHPVAWAKTQHNLGNVWSELPTGDSAVNRSKAAACYKAALGVYTRDAHPVDWAETHYSFARALLGLSDVDSQIARCELLNKAVASVKAALLVWANDSFSEYQGYADNLYESCKARYLEAGCGDEAFFDDIPPAP